MTKLRDVSFIAVVEQPEGSDYSKTPQIHLTLDRLPDDCARTKGSSKRSLQKLQSYVTQCLGEYLPDASSRLLIWQLDENNTPRRFVTGMIDPCPQNMVITSQVLGEWARQRRKIIRNAMSKRSICSTSTCTVEAAAEFSGDKREIV